uniref:ubiquitinyl hydrolase 1 n=1 Tax=Gadus morhua TaxID=8049 RepID=A0A8C5C7J9_GADMO
CCCVLLTGGPKDELEVAIELSLQESHTIQEEERELTRALEASAEESGARVKRKRCEAPSEACSPTDWIRQEDWPVGIRNVGNTCWFSAVIQSLFHLPEFRRLVLNYCISERVLEKCKSNRNLAFMQELRCLFALMVGSTCKFVDPSASVELLRDAFRSSEAQQDVSEFTHKLLDWLEDAFQLSATGKSEEDKKKNPMVQLFYGNFVTERKHEGKILSNIEQFGQYPLQVNGFNNLDECLEGAMVEREIESLHPDQTITSNRERWFSKLPPVLTFELSRFEFNAQLGRPEKIHKKLEFPQVMYMDRYLHKNIAMTHGRRGEVKRLKEQLATLQQKLECYKNYGSGPLKYPLADMLQFVLEFATTKPPSASQAEDPRNGGSPATPPPSDQPAESAEASEGVSASNCQRTPIYKPFTQCRPPMECPPHPAPHDVSEEELHHVRACLQRWRSEVESSITELKVNIERVSQVLEGMYRDNSLCQVPYRLHAVLVHEGQASAGHYWAYIYDHANKRWMKYNDIAVTESSWEELMRDSYGGMTNASAYCLMYVDERISQLVAEDTDDETGQVLRGMDSLPPVLRRYVHADNCWFQQEISEWEEQFCQSQQVQQGQASQAGEPATAAASGPQEEETSPGSGPEAAQQTPEEEEGDENDAEVAILSAAAEGSPEAGRAEDGETGGRLEPGPRVPRSHRDMEEDAPEGESEVSEVDIPNVGRITVRADADGYNEESMLTPAMQGVIMAIAKARQVFDADGPEAGLIKAFHEEYARLFELSQEDSTLQSDVRLHHALVYYFQNQAPGRIIERALLETFTDRNLSFDDRAVSIMREARSKLRLIKPEDMDMDEYLVWTNYYLQTHNCVSVVVWSPLCPVCRVREALIYLAHAYQSNASLLKKGERRGVKQSVIALYRRKCLAALNESASQLFRSGEETEVEEGVAIMNEAIIPCLHLMSRDATLAPEDADVMETIRDHWCTCLSPDMDDSLQVKLGEILPRVLDSSAEMVVLKDPPKVHGSFPNDLCTRLAAAMESIRNTSIVVVK